MKRGQIFQISKTLPEIHPPLFELIDLMKDKVEGHFYKEQLVKCSAPDYQKDLFFVEKVLHKKKIKGKNYYLVKFLFYPNKFNEYIPEENLIS